MKNIIQNSVSKLKNTSDYIIIGAGSAGAVLANRLSQDSKNRVNLIEAGKSDIGHWDSWKIQMPSALTYNLANEKYNWFYETQAQEQLNKRKLHWPRGKCLGGSSSHNAMVYIRGNGADFDRWEQEGANGWSYEKVLPYFKKSQNHELGEDRYRGINGPLEVTRGKTRNILYEQFIESGIQAGYNFSADLNGYQQEGFGFFDMTIHRGVRWSTANAYLRECERRSNVQINKSTMVKRLLFNSEKDRCIGVEVQQQGETVCYYAEKEVILSAGAINSPQILQLSGVGDISHLSSLGIPIIHHNPFIGQNLQDHIEIYMQFKCLKPITLYKYGSFLKHPITKVKAGLEWFLFQSGVCSSNHFESGGFIRSDKGVQHPDIQYHFMPAAVHGQLDFMPYEAFQLHVGTLRPKSKGSIKIVSKDYRVYPIISPQLCSDPADMQDMIKAVQLTIEIMNQPSWNSYKGNPINFSYKQFSTAQGIEQFIRQEAQSSYHASCTLPIGKVVDSQGKFIGIQALRVVDASIMPSIISGNLNASVIMIAEKIADNILSNLPLNSLPVQYYIHPNWKHSQR